MSQASATLTPAPAATLFYGTDHRHRQALDLQDQRLVIEVDRGPDVGGASSAATLRSERSCPAQKPRPAPVSSTARASSRRWPALRAAPGACRVEAVEAVRAVQRDRRHAILQTIQNAFRPSVSPFRGFFTAPALGAFGGLIMAHQMRLTKTNLNPVRNLTDNDLRSPSKRASTTRTPWRQSDEPPLRQAPRHPRRCPQRDPHAWLLVGVQRDAEPRSMAKRPRPTARRRSTAISARSSSSTSRARRAP